MLLAKTNIVFKSTLLIHFLNESTQLVNGKGTERGIFIRSGGQVE